MATESKTARKPESVTADRDQCTSEFFERAIRALHELTNDASTKSLQSAINESNGVSLLLRALEDSNVVDTLTSADPLAVARLRGVEARRRLLAYGGPPLKNTAVAALLGISRQAVHKRRKNHQLLGLTLGRREVVYPAWQFDDGGTIPGLESVLGLLARFDDWMALAFMVNPNTRLDGRAPVEALIAGDVAEVEAAARAHGLHGAA